MSDFSNAENREWIAVSREFLTKDPSAGEEIRNDLERWPDKRLLFMRNRMISLVAGLRLDEDEMVFWEKHDEALRIKRRLESK